MRLGVFFSENPRKQPDAKELRWFERPFRSLKFFQQSFKIQQNLPLQPLPIYAKTLLYDNLGSAFR